jgi:hypothetical protein
MGSIGETWSLLEYSMHLIHCFAMITSPLRSIIYVWGMVGIQLGRTFNIGYTATQIRGFPTAANCLEGQHYDRTNPKLMSHHTCPKPHHHGHQG